MHEDEAKSPSHTSSPHSQCITQLWTSTGKASAHAATPVFFFSARLFSFFFRESRETYTGSIHGCERRRMCEHRTANVLEMISVNGCSQLAAGAQSARLPS
eukprot:scaffold64475_cov37-Tisochrysis_lutea.AAC.2